MKASMKKKILALTIVPMEITALALGIISALIIGSTATEDTKKQLEISANAIYEEYHLVNSVEELQEVVSDFKRDNDIDVIVFENDRQLATTYGDYIMRMESKIRNTLKNGDIYFHTNTKVNGESYITYFLPIMEQHECVGAIMAAEPLAYLNQIVFKIIGRIALCSLLVTTLTFVIVSVYIRALINKLNNVSHIVSNMANNDFSIDYDKYSREHDEIEAIFNAGVNLTEQLNNLMTNTKNTANDLKNIVSMMKTSIEDTSNASNDIAMAVEFVATGATTQAEETTNASQKVSDIANEISKIETNADELDSVAKAMKLVKDSAMDTVNGLQTANDEIVSDVKSTNKQVNITSESVTQIQEAVNVIKKIADQTKLLSLNANIEAAHAGEAGRGFAVVASNIGELASQSASSSKIIEDILADLTKNYALIEDNMKNTTANVEFQSQKITEAHEVFNTLEENINDTVVKVNNINDKIENINNSIAEIVDIISNLSAISEENSASTEETMASIEELNATIAQIVEKAHVVENSANGLMEEVNIFKTKKK